MTACAGEETIESRAEHFVRTTYSDVDRVLSVRVDTVTLGDNMNYRIGQAERNKEFAAVMVRGFGGETYQESLDKETAWAAALDSLKDASAGILGEPAAYNCIVVYNNPSNLVWVQLDPDWNLLNITKDMNKVLLNPGGDVPGYFELWKKFND